MDRKELLHSIAAFGAREASDASVASAFDEFVRAEIDCASRELLAGHLTGSAWLVNGAGTQVLLTHHRKLERWLQLGGHADGDLNLAAVALREAVEESGLTDLVAEPDLFDLDQHWIPERGAVPGHWHYDCRFVVRAKGSEDFIVSEESHALAWRSIVELAEDAQADASLRRMALRWLRR